MQKKHVFIAIIVLLFFGMGAYFLRNFLSESDFPTVTSPPVGTTGLALPEGFDVSVFARDLVSPRVIVFDPQGRLLVSEPKAGRVSMVSEAGIRQTLLEGLNKPHGLAFYTDPKTKIAYFYVAEVREVVRYRYDAKTGSVDTSKRESIVNLPPSGRHETRTIGFGNDFRKDPIVEGLPRKSFLSPIKLYTSIGSSCDVCLEDTWKYSAILESDPEGTYAAEVAGGLRNSVFFDFHPQTGEIWATEMGRDGLGDDLPPDEINVIKVGAKYGWPYCYGNKMRDTSFKEKTTRTDLPMDCSLTEAPHIQIPAHSAPLGIAFIPSNWGSMAGDLLVAYHGSWNRSSPTGYKVVKFDLSDNGASEGVQDFITGWLVDKKTIGRPVDLKFDSSGALFISDDQAGMIYKVVKR